jgi:hypothetical protein
VNREGTIILGAVDLPDDTERTKTKRRKIIVIKQRRGESLKHSIATNPVLENLGMSFEKFKALSPLSELPSPKNRTIILR